LGLTKWGVMCKDYLLGAGNPPSPKPHNYYGGFDLDGKSRMLLNPNIEAYLKRNYMLGTDLTT
jgi:hypothetical protein